MEHLLPLDNVVEDLQALCRKNGGTIWGTGLKKGYENILGYDMNAGTVKLHWGWKGSSVWEISNVNRGALWTMQ